MLAKKSLMGTSIGDAFGESFFGITDKVLSHIDERKIPSTTWEFTDDTVMAIAIFEQLEKDGNIDQNELANQFYKNHELDTNRGYGATARKILREIGNGNNWSNASKNVFDGMGSMGNGAAMRAAPIGAYYFNDLKKVKEQAIKSAEVTHANIEGITGAIAAAIATAIATNIKIHGLKITPNDFINRILNELPDTDTKSKINKSLSIPYSYHIDTLKTILGNGMKMIAQDTVPFSVWCAAHNLNNFENALWKAVSALGDRDTICAIVGGIVIMSSDENNIPKNWIQSVEKFNESIFRNK